MKPHEETWIANVEWPIALVELSEDRDEVVATFDAPHSMRDVDRARARLAAQAPAMARLLLEIEWSAPIGGEPACPSCSAFVNNDHRHAPDCEIATVLRAAGVLSCT